MAAVVGGLVLSGLAPGSGRADEREEAGRILAATGVKGGLVVHLGCGDGKLTAALRASDRYLVHGLGAAADNQEAVERLQNAEWER